MKPSYIMEGNVFYSVFNLNANIIQKQNKKPHRNIQNNVWSYIWALCPAKLTYKINHQRALQPFVSLCVSKASSCYVTALKRSGHPAFSYRQIVVYPGVSLFRKYHYSCPSCATQVLLLMMLLLLLSQVGFASLSNDVFCVCELALI